VRDTAYTVQLLLKLIRIVSYQDVQDRIYIWRNEMTDPPKATEIVIFRMNMSTFETMDTKMI